VSEPARPWDWLPIGLYRTAPDGRLLDANPAFARLLGVADVRSLVGRDVSSFYVDPAERVRWREWLEREGVVRDWEFTVRRPDGSVAMVRDTATVVRAPGGEVLHYEGAVEDVSARRQSEQALRESEHFLSTVISSVGEGIIVYDRELRYVVWNRFMEELTGVPAAQAIGKRALDLFPHLRGAVEAGLHRALRGETVSAQDSRFFVPQTGREGWVNGVYAPHTSTSGEVLGVVAVVRDVTELRRREAEVNRLAHALRSISEGVCVSDLEERIYFVNDAWLRIYGYSRDEMLGKHVSLVRPTEGQEETTRRISRDSMTTGFRGEVMNRRKDGTLFPVYLSGSPVHDAEGRTVALIGVVTDLSDRKRLEEQLRHSQKMEAVGRLAGGIAHDFNNLLTAINGYSELLLQRLEGGDPALRADVEEIRRAGERAANLTRQLLAFSRRQELQPRVLDLNQLLRDAQGILVAAAGHGVQLSLDLEPNLWRVRADPSGLEQVLLNLLINARDAMPEGGVVRMRTANRRHDEAARRGVGAQGDFVVLEVSDSGHGMSAETRERVFEPFFTTKGPGKGTGLGLATVYGIVQQSDGHIEVDSSPGKGASFRVFLPRIAQQAAEVRVERVVASGPAGAETVLLVEDEETVRSLAREVLVRRGYRVVEARDGVEALELLDDGPSGVGVVVSDLIMPRLGGVELGRRLRVRFPGLPVLLMSGYADGAGVQVLREEPGRPFLKKPFTPEALANAVRAALDSDGGEARS
jgi:PAS domain S-box-containing protein